MSVKIEDLRIKQRVYYAGVEMQVTALDTDEVTLQRLEQDEHDLNIHYLPPRQITITPDKVNLCPEYNFNDIHIIRSLQHELFVWLEANPDKTISQWPRWKFQGGDIPQAKNLSFYCEYAARNSTDQWICKACPGNFRPNENCLTLYESMQFAHNILKNTETANHIYIQYASKMIVSHIASILKNC